MAIPAPETRAVGFGAGHRLDGAPCDDPRKLDLQHVREAAHKRTLAALSPLSFRNSHPLLSSPVVRVPSHRQTISCSASPQVAFPPLGGNPERNDRANPLVQRSPCNNG